jgi:ATP-binding cassette subfamily F protein uup
MPLIGLRNVSFTHGGPLLLDHVNLEIEPGERIGLVGRNGTGKSTLLKLLDGTHRPDDGEIFVTAGATIKRLVQDVPQTTVGTVREIVKSGHTSQEENDWDIENAADKVITRLGLDSDAEFSKLSSGMKRRVLLGQALIDEPDALLLDEPTNHLDIESIAWLEKFLKGYAGTVIFITHDREFLQALANRIVEVERARLFDWTCDYKTFLERKQWALEAEEREQALFDKKLAQEEVWIRQGVKARRTRNEGRVRALKAMREQRRQRREKLGNVAMSVGDADKSGQLVMELKNVTYSIPGRTLINDFTSLISRGDKIGIIGPNGAGKSTLLKILLKELEPESGHVRHGSKLQITYFDQLREQIDEEKTVVENIADGADIVTVNGVNKHVYGYLQEFLFTPDRARQLAKLLSGGERNRLLLARLFKRPTNVMVLDEPTNDLDLETLELLEELLVNFEGTLIIVSHDRAFLNNVVTSTMAVEGDGEVREYFGGFDDYLRQRGSREQSAKVAKAAVESKAEPATKDNKKPTAKKLTFTEQHDLKKIPKQIEELEARQAKYQAAMADPNFFKRAQSEVTADMQSSQQIGDELVKLYARWEELEARA